MVNQFQWKWLQLFLKIVGCMLGGIKYFGSRNVQNQSPTFIYFSCGTFYRMAIRERYWKCTTNRNTFLGTLAFSTLSNILPLFLCSDLHWLVCCVWWAPASVSVSQPGPVWPEPCHSADCRDTCHTSHVTRHTSHVTTFTPPYTADTSASLLSRLSSPLSIPSEKKYVKK